MKKTVAIDSVRAGHGIADTYWAVIEAPIGAPAGSLCQLTQYFAEKGFNALPGYEGPDKKHVLRISGLGNEAQLKELLTSGFSQWQSNQKQQASICINPNVQIEPLNKEAAMPQSPTNMLKQYSGNIAGLTYMAGNLGLLSSALYNPTGKVQPLKLTSSVLYVAGAAILSVFGGKATDTKGAWEVVENTYPKLNDPAYKDARDHAHSITEKTITFFKQYPWETQAILSAIGIGLHMFDASARNERAEVAATAASMAVAMIPALVPEKGGRRLIDFGDSFDAATEQFASDMRYCAKHSAIMAPIIETGFQMADIVHSHPLKVALPVGMFANANYIKAGLDQKDPRLTASGMAWLTGNIVQLMASKGKGASLDDVVSAITTHIKEDKQLANASLDEKLRKAEDVSHIIAQDSSIMQSSEQISKAVKHRLEHNASDSPATSLEAFLPSEQILLHQSPFCSPDMSSFRSRIQNENNWSSMTSI